MKTKTLELTPNCKFIVTLWDRFPAEVDLSYIEHSYSYSSSDTETDVRITKEKAIEIIEFLTEAFSLGKEN